jgi:hypothetical protein
MLVGGGRKNGVSRFKHQDVGLEFFYSAMGTGKAMKAYTYFIVEL